MGKAMNRFTLPASCVFLFGLSFYVTYALSKPSFFPTNYDFSYPDSRYGVREVGVDMDLDGAIEEYQVQVGRSPEEHCEFSLGAGGQNNSDGIVKIHYTPLQLELSLVDIGKDGVPDQIALSIQGTSSEGLESDYSDTDFDTIFDELGPLCREQ